jgi:hypothetical protein
MATSATSTSAPLSNAAKADTIGSDGVFTFTIEDLLANDAGGARENTFFFGKGTDGATLDSQQEYMDLHGITYDAASGLYTVTGGDFEYSVQIGGRGTFSTAQVDVAPHAGDSLFTENFDGYVEGAPLFGVVDLNTENEWSGAAHTELGANGYGGIEKAVTSGSTRRTRPARSTSRMSSPLGARRS